VTARLTQGELRAINEALAQVLTGEFEPAPGAEYEDYDTAKEKIAGRIHWREGE
jgi:hypothetical protein